MHNTDHHKWLASQVPSAKYNNQNVKLTKPKTFSASIGKPQTAKGVSNWAIPKSNEPGPGAYETSEAIKNS